MKWLVKYITSREDIITIPCCYNDTAFALQQSLVFAGYCAWVEQPDTIEEIGDDGLACIGSD
jgi:hypothetical protein